ncbi:MAG: YgiQ family radical SAM protein [Treponema sp.]|uniref:YgiQ family radical SAM protein n=1 Tax=Treponema sp. TaxID=166 RepID=UPI00298E8967|nr:YgiQ family radical SAM protein [Treponema sp.]MCQ2601744.1 YgiQ family radical SAM protein [Treponema sp.]
MREFLIANESDFKNSGLSEIDFVFVSGDGYVDHPSFASALLGRLLEANGYTVAILPQPDWKNPEAFKIYGKPRLAFLVSAGAMDSMVSNYTANNKPRSEDAYAHGGEKGHRPDRALVAYVGAIRQAFKGVNVIIGGIEASLRRCAHYDYWSNTVKRSILLDSKADLLMYGMGETSTLEIASQLASGKTAREIRNVRGTCWYTGKQTDIDELFSKPENEMINGKAPVLIPSYDEVKADSIDAKQKYAESYLIQEQNTDAINAATLIEKTDSRYVVQNPPALPLSTEEMDKIYELPFTRRWHPMYDKQAPNGKTGIPALSEVKFSLTSCRGCFGACSFCAITFHQGRRIQSRSHDNIIKEAVALTKDPDFKGYIHDIGGPTANFRNDACEKQQKAGACKNRDCLGVNPCPNVKVDHSDYVELLGKLRAIPDVKKVFIRSGIRFDYLMMDKDKTFFYDLVKHHISGQLKVAPEHVNDNVLRLMRKSTHKVYEQFSEEYQRINRELGMKQYLVPYYIAGHPGADLSAAVDVALYLKKTGFVPDQVQDFYPTPGSLATCMYWTGLNPWKKEESGAFEQVYVARGGHERRLQRALLQFNRRENMPLVREALKMCHREGDFNKLYK